jgi:hypothetical protein
MKNILIACLLLLSVKVFSANPTSAGTNTWTGRNNFIWPLSAPNIAMLDNSTIMVVTGTGSNGTNYVSVTATHSDTFSGYFYLTNGSFTDTVGTVNTAGNWCLVDLTGLYAAPPVIAATNGPTVTGNYSSVAFGLTGCKVTYVRLIALDAVNLYNFHGYSELGMGGYFESKENFGLMGVSADGIALKAAQRGWTMDVPNGVPAFKVWAGHGAGVNGNPMIATEDQSGARPILVSYDYTTTNISLQMSASGNVTLRGVNVPALSVNTVGTNTFTMLTTGYTNRNAFDVRVFALQGTGITFTNFTSKQGLSLGTLSVANDFLMLHTNEAVFGTSLTGKILQ